MSFLTNPLFESANYCLIYRFNYRVALTLLDFLASFLA